MVGKELGLCEMGGKEGERITKGKEPEARELQSAV
jgi:hypothetical protein